jgi:phosphoribosylformylglycinamidine cyclo-ligase
VIADVGGFAGLCRLPMGMRDPVLVSGTDGVGTKLKVAFLAGKHDTVGIDLVAMCANDVSTGGADCLFFLDYFATGAPRRGRRRARRGGRGRGLPPRGMRAPRRRDGGDARDVRANEYDLAGFCVGVVDREDARRPRR